MGSSMTNNLNAKKANLRRVSSVPTLLTVPDLRPTTDSTTTSNTRVTTVLGGAEVDQLVSQEIETPVSQEMAASVSSQPSSASLAGMASLETNGLLPQTADPSSMDDLLAAASPTPVAAVKKPGDHEQPFQPMTGSSDNWFAGESWLDFRTLGTIVATVVACALVARAMRPLPIQETFAGASFQGPNESVDVAQSQPPQYGAVQQSQDDRFAATGLQAQPNFDQNGLPGPACGRPAGRRPACSTANRIGASCVG